MELKSFDFSKKIAHHPKHFYNVRDGNRPFPVTIEVDLTNHCNHRCSFCVWGEHINTDKSTLDTEVIKKAINGMGNLGSKAITFTGGGESMIHKNFYEIIEYTKKNNFDVGLITNGSVIVEKKCSFLLDTCDWIRFSISGGDKESYFAVQGKDHFDLVSKNIKMLCDYKTKNKAKTKVGLRMLITKENLYTLVKLVSLHKNTEGIDYIQIAPDHMSTDEGKFWNGNAVQSEIAAAKKILEASTIDLITSGFEILSTSKLNHEKLINIPQKCYAHFYQMAIMADGNVAFCKNARFNPEYQIGNINDNSINEIWNAQKSKDLEKWINPSNCGLTCKNIRVNLGVQATLDDVKLLDDPKVDKSIDPNFVG